MSLCKLDRTYSAKEASEYYAGRYKELTWQERLWIANYLNSVAYNYPENNPPRLDRTVFKAWAQNSISGENTCNRGNPENLSK